MPYWGVVEVPDASGCHIVDKINPKILNASAASVPLP